MTNQIIKNWAQFKEAFKSTPSMHDGWKYSGYTYPVWRSSTPVKQLEGIKIYSESDISEMLDLLETIEQYWKYLIKEEIKANGDPFLMDCTVDNGFVAWTKFKSHKERNAHQRFILNPGHQSGTRVEQHTSIIKEILKYEGVMATYRYGRLD